MLQEKVNLLTTAFGQYEDTASNGGWNWNLCFIISQTAADSACKQSIYDLPTIIHKYLYFF